MKNDFKKITKAVIPVAGLGTRFLPVTKTIPKEMIPIIDTPVIQYIVEEAILSGIKDIIFITAKNKEAIEDYFDFDFELEQHLIQKEKNCLAELVKYTGKFCRFISIRQKRPLGLGHAVLCAQPVIKDEPFAVLLGDDLIDSSTPCIRQLMDIYEKNEGEISAVVAMMEVALEEISKYGIVSGKTISQKLIEVDKIVEKPKQTASISRFAIPGRYILSSSIFDYLSQTPTGSGGEIQLTDALQLLVKHERLLAYQFDGIRYDTGDRLGFIDATLAYALKKPGLCQEVHKMLEKYIKKR